MKNVKHLVKWILVAVNVVTMIAMIGCTEKQEVIHSSSAYQHQSVVLQQEFIAEMGAPLAAPKRAQSSDVETIDLICEFQAE